MDVGYSIDCERLGELSIDILDYADRIMELFLEIDTQFASLENYYEGTAFEKLKIKIREISNNYEKIRGNIISYSDDLIMITKKVKEDSNYISTLINELTETIKAQSKNMID